jgi:hypothetical protein
MSRLAGPQNIFWVALNFKLICIDPRLMPNLAEVDCV